MFYQTKSGDVVDDICHRHYGDVSACHQVYLVNPGLADCGPVLPAGLYITLPECQAVVVKHHKKEFLFD